jgi:hypothetical protein
MRPARQKKVTSAASHRRTCSRLFILNSHTIKLGPYESFISQGFQYSELTARSLRALSEKWYIQAARAGAAIHVVLAKSRSAITSISICSYR